MHLVANLVQEALTTLEKAPRRCISGMSERNEERAMFARVSPLATDATQGLRRR